MSKVTELRNLLRPLLDRHADLVAGSLNGRVVLISPVRWNIIGLIVDNRSGPTSFELGFVIQPMYRRINTFDLSYSDTVFFPIAGRSWHLNQPDVPDLLLETIETKMLPRLRAMKDLNVYIEYLQTSQTHPIVVLEPVAVAQFMLGNIDKAIESFNAARKHGDYMTLPDDHELKSGAILRELLAQGKVHEAIEMLHANEEFSIKSMGLEKFWEPAPYPIEARI